MLEIGVGLQNRKVKVPKLQTIQGRPGALPELMRKNYWLLLLGVVGVYVAAETMGLVFAFRPAISFVRPAAGIALAVVLLFGSRALPGILVGAFIAHGLILQSLAETLELGLFEVLSAAVGLAIAESVEAGTALWMLQRVGFRRSLQAVSDVVKFVIFAALASTLVGAIIGTSTLFLAGVVERELLGRLLISWWFGNAIAAVAITPFLLTWKDRKLKDEQQWEAFCLSLLLILACQIAFGKWPNSNQTSYPLAFLPFPLVMWAALRFRGFGAAVASAFTTIAGVFTVLRTQGLFDLESAFEPVLIQYAFSGSICVTALLISANQAERRRAEQERLRRESEFRSLLSAIPDALLVFDADGRYRQVFTANRDLIVDSPEKLVGKRMHDVLSESATDIGMQVIKKVLETGEPVDTNYPITIDGVLKRFSARVVPYGTAADPLVLWVARDISVLHQTQIKHRADEALLRNLLELQEDERKLLSYELHDGLVQYMVAAHMTLEAVARNLTPDQESSQESLKWSRELIHKSIDEARALISELRPMIIDESGIVESIGYLINELLGPDYNVQFIPMVNNERLPPLLEGTVFRIVQELLSNIREHSKAKNVKIQLVQNSSTLQMTIEDDGVGFDMEDKTKSRLGVEQVTKRVDLFGGQSKIVSAPDCGTRIDVVLPFELPTDAQSEVVTLSPLRESPDGTPTVTLITPRTTEHQDANSESRGVDDATERSSNATDTSSNATNSSNVTDTPPSTTEVSSQ